MVKNMIVKRVDKSLTVEEYWDIRESLKINKKIQKPQSSYLEDKIDRRYRYEKHKDLVKNFNPLAIILQDKIDPETTHTAFYIDKIGSLPRTISKLRNMTLDVTLMLHNLPKIFKLLVQHLNDTQQTWSLLVCILKDTREQAFDVFMNHLSDLPCQLTDTFHKTHFQQLFDVLATFYQTNFTVICSKLQQVWTAFCKKIFQHNNKYLRSFGIESFAYILNKLEKQQFYKFLYLQLSQDMEEESACQILADSLFHHLKFIGNYLTHISIEKFTQLWGIFYNEEQYQIITKKKSTTLQLLLIKLSDRLASKNYSNEEILFNLYDVIVILENKSIKWLQLHKNISDIFPVINTITYVLKSTAFEKITPEIRQSARNLIKACIEIQNSHHDNVIVLLGLVIKQKLEITDNLYNFLLASSRQDKLLLIRQITESNGQSNYNLSKELIKILVLSLKTQIKQFTEGSHQQSSKQLIYKMCLIFKHSLFTERLQLAKLSISQQKMLNNIEVISKKINLSRLQDFRNFEVFFLLMKLSKNFVISENNVRRIKIAIQIVNIEFNKQLNIIMQHTATQIERSQNKLFDIHNFLPPVYLYCEQKFKTLTLILNFKQEALEFAKIHQIKILTKESQYTPLFSNRISLLKLNEDSLHMALKSRIRQIRSIYLSKLPETPVIALLKAIDSQEIGLDTERQSKRNMIMLQKIAIPQQQVKLVMYWCIGFSFTGFKLIDQVFTNFLSGFLTKHINSVSSILYDFILYFNFRLSRVFSSEIQQYISDTSTAVEQLYNTQSIFINLFSKNDYPVASNDSTQTVAFQRITQALEKNDIVKQTMAQQFNLLLNAYFNIEFHRSQNQIEQSFLKLNNEISEKPLELMPPHPQHMSLLLRLVTKSFLPNYECLHYNASFLEIFQRKKLKTLEWEKLWDKKVEKIELNLTKRLSKDQLKIYLHFLWRLILDANQKRRQTIFEHIRSIENLDIVYLININLHELFLNLEWLEKASNAQILSKLSLIPQKRLISQVYILSSFFKTFKLTITPQIEQITRLLILVIQLCEHKRQVNKDNQYKLVKKETVKALVIFFQEFAILPQHVYNTAHSLLHIIKRNIQYLNLASTNSVPGVLRILEQWSKLPELHNLFNDSNMLNNLSKVLENQQPNKEIIDFVNTIFLNLLENPIALQGLVALSKIILERYMDHLKNQKKLSVQSLKIVCKLAINADSVKAGSSQLLIKHLGMLTKDTRRKEQNQETVILILQVIQNFSHKEGQNSTNYSRLIYLIPELETEYKTRVVDIISRMNLRISEQVHSMVKNLHSTVTKGLIVEPDFKLIFEAIKQFEHSISTLNETQKQYVVLNLLSFVESEEMSLRINTYSVFQLYLDQLNQMEVFRRLFRVILKNMKSNIKDEIKFYSYVIVVGSCVKYLKRHLKTEGSREQTFLNISSLVSDDPQNNFFRLIVHISQSNKLKALNMLKNSFKDWKQVKYQHSNTDLPNAITNILFPVLEEIIFKKKDLNGNLTSSLVFVSNQLYGQLYKYLSESQVKQELKRLISKIKFTETHNKNNINVVKLINQIFDNVQLDNNVLTVLDRHIQQKGLEILEWKREDFEMEDQLESQDQFEEINRNYINLDKKLIAIEDQNNQQQFSSFMKFLRHHIVVPLKSMLFFQSKSKEEDREEKGRIFLAIALTKILIRFPMQLFLIEFNKIVTKLCRMLKKKDNETRENARKCLTEIVKITGPSLLYIVFREMKFHLKDNFEHHILNYSIHYLLEKLSESLTVGKIDYCLPLLLPCIFDEIFGTISNEKELIDKNEIATPMYEAKKRKGFELLVIVAKQLSMQKLEYFTNFLKSELKKHLVSEQNMNRFETVINNIISGFYKNAAFNDPAVISKLLSKMIKESDSHLKDFEIEEHLSSNTIKQEISKQQKITKNDVLTIQQEAAKGGSIFRKMTRDIANKRNQEILMATLTNFYLSFFLLCLKKDIITEQYLLENKQLESDFSEMLQFVLRCLSSRQNALLVKALRICSWLLKWKNDLIIKQKRRIALAVLKNLSKLTNTDQQLVKECFSVINYIFSESVIPQQIVSQLLVHVKLYMLDGSQQAFELLRILVVKEIKDKDLAGMIELVKDTMISTYNNQIQGLCKSIYVSYLKNYKLNQHHKTQQIMFLVKNLDYKQEKGRIIIIDVFQELLSIIDHKQLEYFADIIMLGLTAAFANEEEEVVKQKIFELQQKIIKSINKSKVKTIVNQSMCWARDESDNIKLNGLNTLNLLKQSFGGLLKEHQQEIVKILSQVIERQYTNLKDYCAENAQRQNQSKRLKNESGWDNIISSLAVQPVVLSVSACTIAALNLVTSLETQVMNYANNAERIYFLCQHSNKKIHILCLGLLQKNNTLFLIGNQTLVEHTVSLVKNIVQLQLQQSIQLFEQLIEKLYQNQMMEVIRNLFIALRKTVHHRMKSIQLQTNQLKYILRLLNTVMTYNRQVMTKIMNIQQIQQIIIETVFKYTQQTDTFKSVSYETIEKLEQLSENIKALISPNQFYRMIGEIKSKKKVTASQKKAKMQQLAIVDPQRFHEIKNKPRKKVKKL